jgi:hypothetical protein
MNNDELLGVEDMMVEQVVEQEPEQPKTYNLLNLYRSNSPASTRKSLSRSRASRNLIYNTLGFKNPIARYHARPATMATQGTISETQAPVKQMATRSTSPKAKHLGGKRRRRTARANRRTARRR